MPAFADRPRETGIDLRDFGVRAGDGNDHTSEIQAALDQAAFVGGIVSVGKAGILNTSATLEIPFGVVLAGVGANGEVFGHDPLFPNADGTMIRQVSGTNQDVIRTKNFAVLTGSSSPSPYTTPSRFGLRDLVIDGGQYVGNTSGVGLRIFGRSYRLNNVIIQNCAGGGLYSEWGPGGYDMEATIDGFHVFNCGGTGLEWRGPHDSQFSNVIVGQPMAGAAFGIRLVRGSWIGGEGFTNTHAWGSYTGAVWEIGTSNGTFESCVSDGGGVRFTNSGNVWSGQIYGTQTPGQAAVTFGDGSTSSVNRNLITGQIWNFRGSPLVVIAPNATSTGNTIRATARMGGAIRYAAKNFQTTLTSPASSGATTLNVGSTTGWPATATNVYADDGTARIANISYTGRTATTLTGVSGVTSSLALGAGVWVESSLFGSDNLGADAFDVMDHDHPTNGVFFRQTGTVASDSNNSGVRTFTSGLAALGGFLLSRQGVASSRLWGGSGAPTFSATSGDYYLRSDTPTVANQRLYVCTGGTAWTGIL